VEGNAKATDQLVPQVPSKRGGKRPTVALGELWQIDFMSNLEPEARQQIQVGREHPGDRANQIPVIAQQEAVIEVSFDLRKWCPRKIAQLQRIVASRGLE